MWNNDLSSSSKLNCGTAVKNKIKLEATQLSTATPPQLPLLLSVAKGAS
jgi:hypothetical protein